MRKSRKSPVKVVMLLRWVAAAVIAGLGPVPVRAQQPVTAFVDVAVVPMDREHVLPHYTVLVEDGRITALGPAKKIKVPAHAHRIDGRGQYLIPGLTDMHVHIAYAGNLPPNLVYDSAAVEDRLFLWLANGITTVRNLDYLDANPFFGVTLNGSDLLRLRARAAAGTIWSPRIYTSGQWFGLASDADLTSDRIDEYVNTYKAAGYDFLKVRTETPAVFEAVTAAARRVGLPVVGHVPPGVSLAQALAGMTSIEHLMGYHSFYEKDGRPPSPFDHPDSLRAWVAATQRAGVWNDPTTTIFPGVQGGDSLLAVVKALHDAGAGLLTGTDAPLVLGDGDGALPLHGKPGMIHQDLAGFVAAGLTPYQALVASTRNAATYFGTLAETGTIAVGKRADLVLLAGNPLEDIRHTATPSGVMIGGRWLAREELDRRVADIVARVS